MTTINRKERKSRRTKLGAALLAIAAVFAFVYILTMHIATAQSGNGYSSTQWGGMMSGHATGQNRTAECNQMMSSYGINQTVINSMDRAMSSVMMGMMQ